MVRATEKRSKQGKNVYRMKVNIGSSCSRSFYLRNTENYIASLFGKIQELRFLGEPNLAHSTLLSNALIQISNHHLLFDSKVSERKPPIH